MTNVKTDSCTACTFSIIFNVKVAEMSFSSRSQTVNDAHTRQDTDAQIKHQTSVIRLCQIREKSLVTAIPYASLFFHAVVDNQANNNNDSSS